MYCLVNVRLKRKKDTIKEHKTLRKTFSWCFSKKLKGRRSLRAFEKKLNIFLCRNFCRDGMSGSQIGRPVERSRHLLYSSQRIRIWVKTKKLCTFEFWQFQFFEKVVCPPLHLEITHFDTFCLSRMNRKTTKSEGKVSYRTKSCEKRTVRQLQNAPKVNDHISTANGRIPVIFSLSLLNISTIVKSKIFARACTHKRKYFKKRARGRFQKLPKMYTWPRKSK